MQVEAVASDMEQPLRSVMLVTTAHILASDSERGAGQQDEPVSADGADLRSGAGEFLNSLRRRYQLCTCNRADIEKCTSRLPAIQLQLSTPFLMYRIVQL